MKKNKNMTKKIIVNTLVCSLIHTQVIGVSYASESSINGKDISDAIGIVGNIGNQNLQNKAQIIQAQMSQQQLANIQKSMQPSFNPSKYFPECKLPATMQNMPQNVCQVTSNPQQLATMYGYEAAAQNMINFYDQMLNEATPATGGGISCLNTQSKKLNSQLTEMINNLTRLQTQLKEESQIFRENNKKLINDLEETNRELMGTADQGSARNSIEGKTKDFTKMVSPTCQKVLGQSFQTADQFGFNGLLSAMGNKNRSAYDYSQSKGQLENEIRSQATALKDSIADVGVENWTVSTTLSSRSQLNLQDKLSSYKGMGLIIEKEKTVFNSQRNRIMTEINQLSPGLQVPTGKTGADLQSFINGSQDYFKKKYVEDCVLNPARGVAIDKEKLLGSIEQKNTENSPAAIAGYKQALLNILNSDDYISDKLEQIKALENTYKGMTVTYTNASGSTAIDSPYDVLAKTEKACQSRYTESQTFSKNSANGLSEQEKAKKVQALLQDYKNLSDGFASKLSNNVINTLINCNGEGLKATDTCDEKVLDPGASTSFCMAKANACASNMLSCYTEINTQVEKRKTRIANTAKQFNANVEQMINRANALYKSQVNNVTALTKMLQSKFPGTNFEIPNDMFIQLPETKKDKYGIEMAMDGDINKIIEILPKKIDSLKEMFANQQQNLDQEVGDYIGKQKQAMVQEQGRFKELLLKCTGAAEQSARGIAEANRKGQEEQAKKDQALGEFCNKYSALASSPVAGCDDAKSLYEDSMKVSSMIDPKARQNVSKFKALCNSYNNESDSDGNSSKRKKKKSSDKMPSFDKLCLKDGEIVTDNKAFFDAFINSTPELKKIKDWEKVKDYVLKGNGSKSDFPEILQEEPYANIIDKMASQMKSSFDLSKYSSNVKEYDESTIRALKKTYESRDSLCARFTLESFANNTEKFKSTPDGEKAKVKFKSENEALKEFVSNEKDYKDQIKKVMAEYNQDNASDEAEMRLSDLGEQDIASTPCVANSNSSVGKNPFAFDLNSYDQSRLGAGGASR